ncbi:uncharacterized protein LOC133824926 [Humulus lupulus]|uniref:uncharacterized protein LOC133824926 n=1 Tax=Humulus lupulus TaxID=3486 RepID=UPI002B40633E|nr:uncharacterized protein LOC133824926 [Humulus lupulus]
MYIVSLTHNIANKALGLISEIMWNVKNLLWHAAKGCLPTEAELQSKHVDIDLLCPVCLYEAETIFHSLVTCSGAQACWHQVERELLESSRLDFCDWLIWVLQTKSHDCACMGGMVCWSIWKARNEVVWKNRGWKAEGIVVSAKTYFDHWKMAQENSVQWQSTHSGSVSEIVHWTKPKHGRIKINVDITLFANRGSFGVGWVVRNDEGLCIDAFNVRGVAWSNQLLLRPWG